MKPARPQYQRPIRGNMTFALSWLGPAISLLVGFITGGILVSIAPEMDFWKRPYVTPSDLLRSLVWVNIFLGLFDLLRLSSDGGRVSRDLCPQDGPVPRHPEGVSIGETFAMAFMFAGIWDLWLILVGLFLFAAAQLEEHSAVFQSVLETVHLEDVMLTDFATFRLPILWKTHLRRPSTPCRMTSRLFAVPTW